jgi:hypothetical protein
VVPVRETMTDGSEALELRDSVALSMPVVEGVKITDKVALPPAASVYGKLKPLTLKPLPVKVALEIVRLDPPELERVSACV